MKECITKPLDKPALMGHIIANFPNHELSLRAAKGIILGGAEFLEIQIPFSDSNADGVVIQEACQDVLEGDFQLHDAFKLVRDLNSHGKIILMTYANIIFKYGIEKFILEAKNAGSYGLIIPDLPLGEDEGLRESAKKHDIFIIELITPNMPEERMREIIHQTPCEILYIVARSGITGDKTAIDQNILDYLKKLKELTNKRLAIGFGIQSYEQVSILKDYADIIVAGSYFVTEIKKDPSTEALKLSTERLMGRV